MKIICRKVSTGKTKELIKESLEKDIPILTLTPLKRKYLEEKSLAYFQLPVKTIPIEEAKEYKGKVLIDDIEESIDTLLKLALNNPNIGIDTVTISA